MKKTYFVWTTPLLSYGGSARVNITCGEDEVSIAYGTDSKSGVFSVSLAEARLILADLKEAIESLESGND